MADVRTGGARFKQLREAAGLKQRQLEDALHGAVRAQQISRIENGQIEKPPMADLVAVGNYFGLGANEIAEAFGYQTPLRKEAEATDARLILLETLVRNASPDVRQKLLHWVELLPMLVANETSGGAVRPFPGLPDDLSSSGASGGGAEPPDVANHVWSRPGSVHLAHN